MPIERFPQIVALLVVAVLSAGGCGDSSPAPPLTWRVAGTVLDEDGRPLDGGIIQFLSQRDPTLNMSSVIQPDGSFELQTIHGNENLHGAIKGPCQVMVTPPIVAVEVPEVIVLSETYHIAEDENHFVIQLDRPPAAEDE